MSVERIVKALKRDYLALSPSPDFPDVGWHALRQELDGPRLSAAVPLRMIRFISVVVFFVIIGLVQASGRALPGEPLYGVKVLSEKIYATLSGNLLPKAQHRAEEMNGTLENKDRSQTSPEPAVKIHTEAVSETKREVKNDKKNTEPDDLLKKQEKQIKKTIEDNPEVKKAVEGAIQSAQEDQKKLVK